MKNYKFPNPIQLAAIGCALLLPGMLSAETAPLVADAHINPGSGLNFGVAPALNLGGAGGSQALLRFDLGNVSGAGSALASATLRVYVNSVSVAGTVDLSAANIAWTESSVSGTSGIAAGASIQAGIPVTSSQTYITFDVTNQVRTWLNGAPNTGFLLAAGGGSAAVLDSKESVGTSHPATLEVVFFGCARLNRPRRTRRCAWRSRCPRRGWRHRPDRAHRTGRSYWRNRTRRRDRSGGNHRPHWCDRPRG